MTGGPPAGWQHRLALQLRWDDFDRLGHLNHAVYEVFMAQGRVALVNSLLGTDDDLGFVLVRTELDYRREVTPEEKQVVVSGRVAGVGRKSVTFEQQLVRTDGTVVADSRAVVVAWDGAARTARELTDRERAALTAAPDRPAVQ